MLSKFGEENFGKDASSTEKLFFLCSKESGKQNMSQGNWRSSVIKKIKLSTK